MGRRLITIALVAAAIAGLSMIRADVDTSQAAAFSSDGSDAARAAFFRAVENADLSADFTTSGESTAVALQPSLQYASSSVQALSTTGPNAPFPHIAMYGGANSSGWPFVGSIDKVGTCSNNPSISCAVSTDCGDASYTCNNPASRPADGAPLNADTINSYAKFQHIILPPTPFSDGRTDVLPAIRAQNPKIEIVAYVIGYATWCPGYPGNISYPVGWYYRDYYLAVSGGDPSCTSTSNRFLWNQAGALWGGSNVNLAYREQQPDGSYRYPVAEAIAEAIYNHAKSSKGFDGIFIDIFCRGVRWAETPTDLIDYARAGYGSDNTNPANAAAFDVGWAAGHQALSERLRALAVADGNPDYPIAANCGQSPKELFPVLNGWMRENYPFQNGGTFFSNMLTYPWGLLHQDYLFRAPQYNYIFTGADPSTQPYSSYNQQKMRFGLGSATLGNGFHAFEDTAATPLITDYQHWWFDEYGVNTIVPHSNPDYGVAKNSGTYTGWLGLPTSNAYQYLLPNANPELLPTNDFEQDVRHVELRTFDGATASIDRDTSAPAVGAGDLHVRVDGLGTYPSSILLNSDVFQATNGTYYSLTFWAKATKTRGIAIAIDGASLSIPISDRWQRYQVSVRATATGNAVYQLQLGHDTGDLWFDDFRIQAGVGNVYRRDFDRGIVLVNPYNVPLTVPLEKPYKRILGTVNPSLNDGSIVTSVTLTPDVSRGVGDAVFLLNYDIGSPDRITDLRAQ